MSRQLLLSLFGALGALLLATIGFEIFARHADEADGPAVPASQAPEPAAAPAGSALAGAQHAQWVASILSRPLFSVTRKPEAAPAAQVSTAGDEQPNDLPRLAGISLVRGAKRAYFQPLGDVPPLVVGEGEQVSGWQVEKIELTSVTLTGPNGRTTVEPKFDENAVPPPPQMPAVPPQSMPRPPRINPVAGQPPGQPAVRPNILPNPGQPQRPGPGQPTAVPIRPPFIPQQRSVPLNGPPVPPGAR